MKSWKENNIVYISKLFYFPFFNKVVSESRFLVSPLCQTCWSYFDTSLLCIHSSLINIKTPFQIFFVIDIFKEMKMNFWIIDWRNLINSRIFFVQLRSKNILILCFKKRIFLVEIFHEGKEYFFVIIVSNWIQINSYSVNLLGKIYF